MENVVIYNPTNKYYKSVVGAVQQNAPFSLRVCLNKVVKPSSVTLVVYNDDGLEQRYTMNYEHNETYDNYVVTLSLAKGLYFYYFVMDGVSYERFIGVMPNKSAGVFYDNVMPWQLSVYDKLYSTPTWLNKGVMYQILPDRFCSDGNTVATEGKLLNEWGSMPVYYEEDGKVLNRDFCGGNLNGIASKLSYLNQLGVTVLYLNPIFKAYSNHKYDTEDYEQVDAMFGTYDDFVNLVKKAESYGIRIILDGVFNHVGVTSKYFVSAVSDNNSPYRSWFNFRPDGSYESWWNFPTLPRINGTSSGARNYFCGENGIVPRWLVGGASGWRLDVVDELPDVMLDDIVRSAKLAKPDCALIGEVWEDASNKISYGSRRHYLDGSQLDSVMNYPLKNAIISFVRYGDEQPLFCVTYDIINNYPLHVRNNLMNILGTHDTTRILTALAGDVTDSTPKNQLASYRLSDKQYNDGITLLQLAVVLQYTYFGFPCVYYGDEAGMEGGKDPFCRMCYPWGNENKLLLNFYRSMGALRKLAVFSDGDFEVIKHEQGMFAFSRSNNTDKVIVAVNRGKLRNLALDGTYEDLLTGKKYVGNCTLVHNGYVIIKRIIADSEN